MSARAARTGSRAHAPTASQARRKAAFFGPAVHRKTCHCPDCEAKRPQRMALVGSTTDPAEAEADRLAETALATPEPLPADGAAPETGGADIGAPAGEPIATAGAMGAITGGVGADAAAGGGTMSLDAAPVLRLKADLRDDPEPPMPIDITSNAPEPMAAMDPSASADGPVGTDTPDIDNVALRSRLEVMAGTGLPLPDEQRAYFERRFGRDLDAVRLHLDAEAADLARQLQALAFAYGQDIYFAEGHYAPDTFAGRFLLAHEIVHTIQQSLAAPDQRSVRRDGNIDNIANPPQSRMNVQMSGLTFTPINGTWSAGDRMPQVQAIALRRFLGAGYQPGMVARFNAWNVGGSPTLSGDLTDVTEAPMGLFHIIGSIPFDLLTFCETASGSATSIQLSDHQRRLIRLGRDAERAWTILLSLQTNGAVRALPRWFTKNNFFHMIGSRIALLTAFTEAYTAASRTGSAASDPQVIARATDIHASIAEQTDVIEAIRTDTALINHFGYKMIWPPAARPDDADRFTRYSRSRTAIATDDPDQADSMLIDRMIPYLRSQPALARRVVGADAADATAARRELLERFIRIIQRVIPTGTGDQEISDNPGRLATDPGHPARLSVYPALEPPFFDAATDMDHHFTMSINFPDVFDAFQRYTYRFALFKMPEAQVIGAAGTPTPDPAAAVTETPAEPPPSDTTPPAAVPERAEDAGEPLVPLPPGSAPVPEPPTTPPPTAAAPGPVATSRSITAPPPGGQRVVQPTGTVLGTRLARDARYLRADVSAVIGNWETNFGAPGTSLGLVAAGGLLRFAGTLIRSLLETIFEPAYTEEFVFETEGLYLVRAIAYPHNSDEAEVTRTPSIAYLPVFARDPDIMAESRVQAQIDQQTRDSERLAEVTRLLSQPQSDAAREAQLRLELADLRAAEGDLGQLLAHNYWRIVERLNTVQRTILNGADPNTEPGLTLLRLHPLAPQYRALRSQRDALLNMYRNRSARHIPASAERITASFVSDRGQSLNLLLEAVNVTPAGRTGSVSWYVSDVTTPNSGDGTGNGTDKPAAIIAALTGILQRGAGYGRGHLSVLIDNVAHPVRIEAASDQLMLEALENLATVASVAAIAAAPFTGGSSLYLLIPIGVIGAIPSAYRIVERVSDETFRWDLQTATDLVNIVSSVVGVGQVAAGARAASLAARGVSGGLRAYMLSGALMVTGFGLDGLGIAMMGVGIMEQLQATSDLPEGLRQAAIAEIVGNAMVQAGIMIGGSLASHRYQSQLTHGIEDSTTAYSRWFGGLEPETQARLQSEPRLMEVYSAMHPEVRRLLTRCGSWCIPIDHPPDVAMQNRLQAMVDRLHPTADDTRLLQAYFHDRRATLDAAIGAVEGQSSLAALRQHLTGAPAGGTPLVRPSDAVLLSYSSRAVATRSPANIATIDRILATGTFGVARLGNILDSLHRARRYGTEVGRILGYVETLVTTRLPGHDQVLADLEFGHNKLVGAEFVLRYITDNALWSSVSRFEFVQGGGARRYDAVIGGVLIQFKNWQTFLPVTFLRQFMVDYNLIGAPTAAGAQWNLRWILSSRLGLSRVQIEATMIAAIRAEAALPTPRAGYDNPRIVAAMIAAIQSGTIVVVH